MPNNNDPLSPYVGQDASNTSPVVSPGAGSWQEGVDQRGIHYVITNGKKYYQPPNNNSNVPGGYGGWFHSSGLTWDADTGEYVRHLSPNKIVAWISAGVITAGLGSALMSGPATGAATGGGAAAGTAGAATGSAGATGALGATGAVGAGVGTGAGATGAAVGTGAGVTTASSVLGGYGPLIGTGVGAAANLIGARMQTNASREAAEIQDRYLREALAYEKEKDAYERQRQAEQTQYDRQWKEGQYADIVSRMNPYILAGGNAADRQARLLGLPTSPSPNQAPLSSGRVGAPTVPSGNSGSAAGAAAAAGGGPTLNPPPSGPQLPVPGQGLPTVGGTPLPTSSPMGGQPVPRTNDSGVIDYGGGRTSANDGWARNPDGSYGTGYYDTHPGESPYRNVAPAPEMVLLQSPSGTQKQVPADQVDYWLQKGATRV